MATGSHLTKENHISSQAGTPTSTPSYIGQLNIDTTNDKVYVATGTTNSSDWTDATASGGGGSSGVYTPSSPSGLGTINDNYALPASPANYIRLTATGASALVSGFVAKTDGTKITLVNVHATAVITLENDSNFSTEANRILCSGGANLNIDPGQTVTLIYDGTTSRWREYSHNGYNQLSLGATTLATRPNINQAFNSSDFSITVSSNDYTINLGSSITKQGNSFNSFNQLVQMDGLKLPAVDGSQLTNLPSGASSPYSFTNLKPKRGYIERDVEGIGISANGLKVYTVHAGTPLLGFVEWTLGTANDIGSLDMTSRVTANFGPAPNGESIFFKSDGTKLFVMDILGDVVTEWALSTAWDLSTATYTTNQAIPDVDYPLVFTMKTDGTKAYFFDNTDKTVYQSGLSTAWDITTLTTDSKSFDASGQVTNPRGIDFSSDGTKMFLHCYSTDTMYQYTLSTAWDVSTASYDSVSFSFATQANAPISGSLSEDGTKVYVIHLSNDTIYQYTMSTAWDLSTISYDSKTLAIGSQDSNPRGARVFDSGTRMYHFGVTNDTVYQYTLSTAYDISTGSYDSKSLAVGGGASDPRGIHFKPDGTKVYVSGGSSDTFYQFDLGTAWDISTINYGIQKSFNASAQVHTATGIALNSTGTKMYVCGYADDSIYRYSLSTAWDISTATYDSHSLNIQTELPDQDNTWDMAFNADETEMFILTSYGIIKYDLSTAGDLTTASPAEFLSHRNIGERIYCFCFANSGASLLLPDQNFEEVIQLDL